MLSHLEPHSLIFTQAAIQLVCWHYVQEYTKWYATTYLTNKRWFQNWSRKPMPGGGEVGEDGVIEFLAPSGSHLFAGIFVTLGYFMKSPQTLITGILSEFAFEVLDTIKIVRERYITKKGMGFKYPTVLFVALLMHHSGAFTVMLPVCMFYADNAHMQRTVYGLLSYAFPVILLNGITSSRDIYDLKERGQFVVAHFLNFVLMVYFRWYIELTGTYGFICDQFPAMSMKWKFLFISFLVFIKLFDCLMALFAATQLYQYLFTAKATVRPTKITKDSLKMPTKIPMALIRCHSAPLC